MEPEVKKDRTESESESSNDGICCGAENRALVEDLETIEPESETDDCKGTSRVVLNEF